MKTSSYNIYKIVLILLLVLLLIYVGLRAYYLSFTIDESASYKILLGDKILERSVNNHLLNTFLMRVCDKLFRNSEFSLRLPNLLAFFIYLAACYKILTSSKKPMLIYAGFSMLLLNPYLLDFFGLARGYGIAMGLAMGSLYFLLRDIEYNSSKRFILNFAFALLLSSMASFANLNTINLNVALVIVFSAELFFLIRSRKIKLNPKNIIAILGIYLVNFALLIILIQRLLMLQKIHELSLGGSHGFITDSLTLLLFDSIYFSYYGENFWIILRVVIIVLFVLMVIYPLFLRKISPLSKIAAILVLMVVAPVLQFYLFKTFFPINRTALIYILLFGLCFFYFIDDLSRKLKKYPRLLLYFITFLFISAPLSYHFIRNVNLLRTREWAYEANTKQVMSEINEIHCEQKNIDKTFTISNNWIFEPTMNYYRYRYSMNFLNKITRDGVDENSDFIYCFGDEKDKLHFNDSLKIYSQFENTQTYFIVRTLSKN